jgi:5'/3'-nucleotidase SurE
MTKVLVTNDDGIDSPGLHALARLAVDHGLELLVAAPARDSSGASASLGAVEERGRVVVEPRPIGALPGVETLAVRAAPAFIVRAALHGAFGGAPDIVLSGVNQGPNTGHAVLHPGTVGAAMTAATYGCRSLAVSLAAGGDRWRWATAVEIARPVLASSHRSNRSAKHQPSTSEDSNSYADGHRGPSPRAAPPFVALLDVRTLAGAPALVRHLHEITPETTVSLCLR